MATKKMEKVKSHQETQNESIDLYWHVANHCGVYVNHPITYSSVNENFILYFVYNPFKRRRKKLSKLMIN